MKFSTFIIALLTSSSVLSQTVIYYEDGTAYTLKDNEHVYVSKARQVYQKKPTTTVTCTSHTANQTIR